jgi:hypothetical protein
MVWLNKQFSQTHVFTKSHKLLWIPSRNGSSPSGVKASFCSSFRSIFQLQTVYHVWYYKQPRKRLLAQLGLKPQSLKKPKRVCYSGNFQNWSQQGLSVFRFDEFYVKKLLTFLKFVKLNFRDKLKMKKNLLLFLNRIHSPPSLSTKIDTFMDKL